MISDMAIGTAIQFVAALAALLLGMGVLDEWRARREERRGGQWWK